MNNESNSNGERNPTDQPKPKGPWFVRFLIVVFSVILGLLIYWLLGFFLDDIGSWPGPDFAEIESQMLDPALSKRETDLERQIADTERNIGHLRSRQELLRDSTTSSQQTMNQLLEFSRLNLQRNVTPTPEEQAALAESEQRFLANQQHYQELNEEIVGLNEKLTSLQDQLRQTRERLTTARVPVQEEYDRLWERHNLRVAAVKLGVLAPLLLAAVVLFQRFRSKRYAALAYAFGIAVLVKVGLVMHEYFPSRFFKYVLIGVALVVVLRVLVYLIRAATSPSRQALLRRFREAYEVFLCPICDFPIRRGPLKFQYWTARSLKKKTLPAGDAGSDQPYTCPACATRLYEECPHCHAIRPSLLPSCPQCGDTRVGVES